MVGMNDFQRQWLATRTDALRIVDEVGQSGWYILGQNVSRFESALASYWGVPCAVGVASGMDALEISLRILGCRPGDEVLTSPISAFATVLAILKLQAIPVFADCDAYGLIDLDRCRKILQQRPALRYFVPVHLYGHALDLSKLKELRDEFRLNIVEDCAQAIGARHHDIRIGTVGRIAATSFYPTKNLGALGDGGAILTADVEAAGLARKLRDYGQNGKYNHDTIGYNSRLDELQAALLAGVGLPHLDTWTQTRRRIASRYMTSIRNPHITVPGAPEGSHSCWHLFPILVAPEHKPSFRSHLARCGVATGEHYPAALVEQEALRKTNGEFAGECIRAIQFCHSEVSLPIHPFLHGDEVAAVVDGCNSWTP
jgi:dTDP-4-amino-4,6-dideoxygalactose transaminase